MTRLRDWMAGSMLVIACSSAVAAIDGESINLESHRGAIAAGLSRLREAWHSFVSSPGTTATPTGVCQPEAGFSPEGSGAALVLKAIDSARREIRVAAYAFTSRDVARALVAAKVRGVDVAVIVDARQNLSGSGRHASAAALGQLLRVGIPVRVVSAYAIHHDKTVVVDGQTVETGSFNFSAAAATRNSEDVLVLWNCPAIARAYTAHWTSRWAQGVPYAEAATQHHVARESTS